jgi:membrane protein YdbS with pleckstrin-like domain
MTDQFCFSCGSAVTNSQAKFCSSCGKLLSQNASSSFSPSKEKLLQDFFQTTFETEPEVAQVGNIPTKNLNTNKKQVITNNTAPVKVIKPRFSLGLQLLRTYINPIYYFLSFWSAGMMTAFVGDFLPTFLVDFVAIFFPENKYFLATLCFTTIICLGIAPMLFLLYKKLTYQKTEYRIFEHRVEYTDNFLSEEWKTLTYKRVVEVHLRKGFIQKLFGLGSIFLEIPASSSEGSSGSWWEGSRNGIDMADIDNSEEVYHFIKDFVPNMQ